MMSSITQLRKAFFVVTLLAAGVILASCENMQSKSSASPAEGKMPIQRMIEMAMGNMKDFMMLSTQDRQSYVMKTQQDSLKHGEELFSSASLGSNGFTCATCHPGGKTTGGKVPMGDMEMAIPSLVGVAATFPKFKPGNDAVITLAEMNNNCVVMFMKGEPIALGSANARDLAFFITNLSKDVPLTPGKQNMEM